MNADLITVLIRLMEEYEKVFAKYGDDNTAFFTKGEGLYVERKNVLKPTELITVRPHTRFTETPIHRHTYIEMMYVCQGSITHVINGRDVVMEAGDILIMNQHISHAIRGPGRDDISINLLILPEFFETALDMLDKNNFLADFMIDLLRKKNRDSQYLHFKLAGNLQTTNLMENLIHSLVHAQHNSTKINQTLMGLLFLYLLENANSLRVDTPNNYEDILLRSILQYIERHYKTATLSEIAADFHFPLPHLSRFVRKKSGRTFKELLQERRLEVARKMLTETVLPVCDIVNAVGYENNSYFYRCFREKLGMSPKEYRLGRTSGYSQGNYLQKESPP